MQLKHKDTREGILKIFRLRDFSQIAKIAKLTTSSPGRFSLAFPPKPGKSALGTRLRN